MYQKNQVHSFTINDDVRGFIILFTEEFISKNLIHSDIISFFQLYNYHLHSPIIHPENTKTDSFAHIIDEIMREYNFPDMFAKEEILRLLINYLKAEPTRNSFD